MPSKNPFLNRGEQRAKQGKAYHRAPKQEKDTAKRLGGATIRGSGKGFKKGDVCVKGLARVECKNTQAASFSITQAMIKTIREASLANGEIPYISVDFLDKAGKLDFSVAVIEAKALEALLNRLRDAENS
jgi:nitrate reductase NapAB chaperone NapD